MTRRAQMLLHATAIAAALALSACDRSSRQDAELASLDNQIAGNDADPAITTALQDQIMVDPTLAQQSNRNAVRPPSTPTQAQYPVAQDGADRPAAAATQRLAQQQRGAAGQRGATVRSAGGSTDGGANGGCAGSSDFDHNIGWARRLPAAFAVYPGSRITDAAGNDRGECDLRVVTFTTRDPAQRVLEWYQDRAIRAGYTAEHQRREGDHIVAGANEGAAFYLIVSPVRGGSEVALIANNGR